MTKESIIKFYAERMARKQAREFISKNLVDMNNDALIQIVGYVVEEIGKENPGRVIALDFLEVLDIIQDR